MTKKDYQAIARAIFETPTVKDGLLLYKSDLVGQIADVMQADNPRFNRNLFIEACETGRCKGMMG